MLWLTLALRKTGVRSQHTRAAGQQTAVQAARAERELQGKAHLGSLERRGVLPDRPEGLIAYIGFDR